MRNRVIAGCCFVPERDDVPHLCGRSDARAAEGAHPTTVITHRSSANARVGAANLRAFLLA
jgi:hypothetical protein